MSVAPFQIQCYRDRKWKPISTDELLPGDVVSFVRLQTKTTIPADLLRGTCIVNEAMLSGESTPLLKETVELRDDDEPLNVDGMHRNAVLVCGTKVLQPGGGGGETPNGGCLAVVLRVWYCTGSARAYNDFLHGTRVCGQCGVVFVHRVLVDIRNRGELVCLD
jgi:cation-transporting ATPase 13A1